MSTTSRPGTSIAHSSSRIGAFATSFGLPLVCYLADFLCNDKTGCPIPSTLHPSSLTLDKLVEETGWPGFRGLLDPQVMMYTLLYYLFSLFLQSSLLGTEVEGTELASGGKLKYKFNGLEHMRPIALSSMRLTETSFHVCSDHAWFSSNWHAGSRARLFPVDLYLGTSTPTDNRQSNHRLLPRLLRLCAQL